MVRCCGTAYLPICGKHKHLLVLNPAVGVSFLIMIKLITRHSWKKKLLTLERANGQIKSTGTWWVLISKCNSYLEETELRKADRTVGVNCNMFTPTVRSAFLSSVYSWKVGTLLLFLILLLLDLISSRLVS